MTQMDTDEGRICTAAPLPGLANTLTARGQIAVACAFLARVCANR